MTRKPKATATWKEPPAGTKVDAPRLLNEQDLREFAKEHLLYEVRMMRYLLEHMGARRPADEPELTFYRARVESQAVHERNLCEFLFENRRRPFPRSDDTAAATDYLQDYEGWIRNRDAAVHAMQPWRIWAAASRQVEHLTYHRAKIGKVWNNLEVVTLFWTLNVFVNRCRLDDSAMSRIGKETADALGEQLKAGVESQGFSLPDVED